MNSSCHVTYAKEYTCHVTKPYERLSVYTLSVTIFVTAASHDVVKTGPSCAHNNQSQNVGETIPRLHSNATPNNGLSKRRGNDRPVCCHPIIYLKPAPPPPLTTEIRMDVIVSKERELSGDNKGMNASLRTMSASQGVQRRCDGSAIFTQVTTGACK